MRFLIAAVCLTVAAAQPGTSPTKKDPTACDGATMRAGVGYNRHPYDCTQYVQCFLFRGGRVEPVYRRCDYGQFWDHGKLRCRAADVVDCPYDKCKDLKTKSFKHSDPNKCGAYWLCEKGKPFAKCCPEGQAYKPAAHGCVTTASCVDMCPFNDRVPGCNRSPISGAPTKYNQYTDNGKWRKMDCPKSRAYSAPDCGCTVDLPKELCKPDLKLTFDKRSRFRDTSGHGVKVYTQNVRIWKGAAYFKGNSRLVVEPFLKSENDTGVFIVKLRYQENLRRGRPRTLQALVTNGHCGKEASVVVGKITTNMKARTGFVLLGAETQNITRFIPLPTVNKEWKEVIYIHDQLKLEGRVCGASGNDYAVGELKDTGCGLQFGASKGMAGYVGLIDDIYVYRCKPLDTVINVNY